MYNSAACGMEIVAVIIMMLTKVPAFHFHSPKLIRYDGDDAVDAGG